MGKKTLFLDRDGVINVRNFNGYIAHPDDFIFLNNAIEGIIKLRTFFDYVIIVTNQQGVGKGLMTLDMVNRVHEKMSNELEKNGCLLDAIFIATNLAEETPNRRKPNSAMALEAQQLFPEINFSEALMVGDTDTDILFGKNLGMKTACVSSKEIVTQKSDYVVTDLLELYYTVKNKRNE